MRGRYLHNSVLAAGLLEAAEGADLCAQEHPADGAGYVDLFVRHGDLRIVCEVELGPDRIHRDLAKAAALRATHLLLVVPTPRAAGRISRRLSRLGRPAGCRVCVLTFGPAKAALRRLIS